MNQTLFWILFASAVTVALSLDLGLHRKSESSTIRTALAWSAIWIALAASFSIVFYFWQGSVATVEFATSYVIELSLSVDNLFIFLLIFRYFQVPARDQHKVLFWGVLGAIVMRGAFIVAGVGLLRRFQWPIYFFGALLIYSGIRLSVNPKSRAHPEKGRMARLFRRLVPATAEYEAGRFFIRRERLFATPLFLVLLLVETTDLVFATDSIPAVLAITLNFTIVLTSNIFAILGLRSMYFALAGIIEKFRYLHYGIAVILVFTGIKIILLHFYKIPTWAALLTVASILAISMAASEFYPAKKFQRPKA